MSAREEWLRRYRTDPEFRLKRLLMLKRKNYRNQGGIQSRNAYDSDISSAKDEILSEKDRGDT